MDSKILPLLLLLLALNSMPQNHYCVNGQQQQPQVPGFFIFGDSLSDSGNNNNLPTTARSNYPPYGIDFQGGLATGRFTNGLTTVDFITQFLGYTNLIPPFANISGQDILQGVNYASGAAGIRPESGKLIMGANIDLGLQITNHEVVVSLIAKRLGGYNKAVEYLSKCLYYFNIGSNDYINNYFLPEFYSTSRIYSPQQYAKVLVDALSLRVQSVHKLGGRKFVLVGLGNIGCTPYSISRRGTNGSTSCVEDENAAASLFNSNLRSLVDQLNQKFSADSKFIFINSTAGTTDLSQFGFRVANASCCPSGDNGQCIPNGIPCQNRNKYVFYDDLHPSERLNNMTASVSYNSSANPAFTYPIDIYHLVHLLIS